MVRIHVRDPDGYKYIPYMNDEMVHQCVEIDTDERWVHVYEMLEDSPNIVKTSYGMVTGTFIFNTECGACKEGKEMCVLCAFEGINKFRTVKVVKS